jgi:transcriptional regulator with XRE-family HTH domain
MLATQAFTSPVVSVTLLVAVDIDWHIGDVIAKLRKRRRMNQTALALKVGVNKATIVRAENGDAKVSRDTYIKIAKTLGTDLAALEVEAARLESGDSESIRYADVPRSDTAAPRSSGSSGTRDGRPLATSSGPDQTPPLSDAPPATIRQVATELVPIVRAREAQLARAARKSPAAAHADPSRARPAHRRTRR